MDAATRRALNRINRRFYAARAAAFSDSRPGPWPGWSGLWPHVEARLAAEAPPDRARSPRSVRADRALRVLDVGCGNGRFARFAAACADRPVAYLGVDASRELLAIARRRDPGAGRYLCADVVEEDPQAVLPAGPFDLVVLFGVLHHVPGFEARRALLRALVDRLAPAGLLAFTVWRFDDLARLRRRSVPWERLAAAGGVAPEPGRLEPGDRLLRWGHDDDAFRYFHFADADEIACLLAGLPAETLASWESDDGGGGNRYLLLGRREEARGAA